MVDYAAAIKKPFEDMQTALIGILIGAVSPLTLGLLGLLITGFGLGVGRKVLNNDNKLPKWDPGQIITYIKDVIMAIIIGLVYMIPAIILFVIGGALAIGGILTSIASGNSNALATLGGSLAAGGIFLVIGFLLAIIGGLLAIMGIQFYLKEGSIGAAFKFGAIIKKELTGTFIAAIVVYIIYAIALIVIATVLSIIPIIGSLVGAGIMAYALTVTSYTMFAQVFKETP